LKKNSLIAIEIGKDQEQDVIALFEKKGWHWRDQKRDLSGIIRALLFQLA